MRRALIASVLSMVLATPLLARDASISGNYLEARTADVYTGPCFANGEVNLVGKEAVLAWQVREGSFEGVRLDGLAVVAVVKASATLGDPHANPLPARSVLIVDARATAEQKNALVSFAKSMGGAIVQDVVNVYVASIETAFEERQGYARLRAGDLVKLETRALQVGDIHCGNEDVYYPPLTDVQGAVPAVTLAHTFTGKDLNTTWSDPHKRSAFIGTFSR